jgi:hypothetical protein
MIVGGKKMSERTLFFTPEENIGGTPRSFWPALVMTGEELDQEIARLGSSRVLRVVGVDHSWSTLTPVKLVEVSLQASM